MLRRLALPLALAASAALRAGAQTPVWPDEGPAKWAPRPTVTAITANDLRTRLYQFADDSMQGRRIGEPGNSEGTAYIAREFARVGLKPAGEHGTYFQDMPFGPAQFDRAASRLSAGGAALTPGKDWIPIAPAAPAATGGRAEFAGVPVVFAGRWADAASVDPALVRGKVAVFLGGPPAGRGFGSRTPAVEPRCDSVPGTSNFVEKVPLSSAALTATAASTRSQPPSTLRRWSKAQPPIR